MDSIRQFACAVCQMSFKKGDHMRRHMMSHSGEKPFQCDICEKSYYRKDHLIAHKRCHTGEKPFKCDLCEKLFLTKQNLTVHQRYHTGELPYPCEYCEKSFNSKGNLKTHAEVHLGDTQCDICGKSFSTNNYLIKHKRVHTDGKPFYCDVCEDSFSSKSDFNNHEKSFEHWKRIESQKNPQTELNYINFDEFIKNLQDVKEEESLEDTTVPKPYPCDVCKKSFKQNHHLKTHKLVHSGEKAYSCDICEKTFARKDTLNRHKRTHLTAEANPSSSNNMVANFDCARAANNENIIKEIKEESVYDINSIKQENIVFSDIQEEIKKEVIDDHLHISYNNKIARKKEIKEEVKDSDEGQGVDDSNLDSEPLVDCSQYVQVQMNLTN